LSPQATGLKAEDEHKTFANAQFFAINGNFLTKERRLFCTTSKLRVALPTLRHLNSIDRLAGAKTHQKVESQTTGRPEECICPRPRETLAAAHRTPSSTIAKKPTQQTPKTKPQAKPAKKNQIAARKTPKDPILPRERQASTSKASKQASRQPPKALSPSPSSPD